MPRTMTHTPEPATLDTLQVGDRATVRAVSGGDDMMIRLMEMGFVRGAPLEFIKQAPLGGPLEVRVRGYHVSLRQAEARRVAIEDLRRTGGAR